MPKAKSRSNYEEESKQSPMIRAETTCFTGTLYIGASHFVSGPLLAAVDKFKAESVQDLLFFVFAPYH